MFLIRGLVFTHEAVRDWEAKLAPLLAEGLRKRLGLGGPPGARTSTRPSKTPRLRRECRRIKHARLNTVDFRRSGC